jgi:hypothetical protein
MPIQPITPTYNSWNGWAQVPSAPPTLRQMQANVNNGLSRLGTATQNYIANNPPYLGQLIDITA